MKQLLVLSMLVLSMLVLMPPEAGAQCPNCDGLPVHGEGVAPILNTDRVDAVDKAFKEATGQIGDKLVGIARNLLFSLLLIEMVWSLGRIVMSGADFGRLMSSFFRRIVIAGFFLFLLDGIPTPEGNIGLTKFIQDSAVGLTQKVLPDSSLKPANILGQMFDTGHQLYQSSKGVGGTVSAVIVWAVIMVVGAILTGLLVIAYIEIYVIFTAGILILGFGAWKVTEAWARNFLFSAVGKIFKLFTLLLIGAILTLQMEEMKGLTEIADGLILIAMSLIFIMVANTVPNSVEAMISGVPGVSADSSAKDYMTALPRQAGAKTGQATLKAGKKAGGAAGKAAGTATTAATRKAAEALREATRAINRGP